jgi:acyl carrier protein
MQDKLDELNEIIHKVLKKKDITVALDTKLKDIDLDSLDFMEIMFEYEDKYKIETGKWDTSLVTVNDLLNKVFPQK